MCWILFMRDEFTNGQNWHSRGFMPHYDAGEKYQFITYRLADSLPQGLCCNTSNTSPFPRSTGGSPVMVVIAKLC